MYCNDLEVMSSNPGQVKLGVRSTSALSRTWTKTFYRGIISSYYLFKNCVLDDASIVCMIEAPMVVFYFPCVMELHRALEFVAIWKEMSCWRNTYLITTHHLAIAAMQEIIVMNPFVCSLIIFLEMIFLLKCFKRVYWYPNK